MWLRSWICRKMHNPQKTQKSQNVAVSDSKANPTIYDEVTYRSMWLLLYDWRDTNKMECGKISISLKYTNTLSYCITVTSIVSRGNMVGSVRRSHELLCKYWQRYCVRSREMDYKVCDVGGWLFFSGVTMETVALGAAQRMLQSWMVAFLVWDNERIHGFKGGNHEQSLFN